MDALHIENKQLKLDKDRCIGCGLCVTKCPTKSISLIRKTKDSLPVVPKNFAITNIKLAQERGVLSMGKLMKMLVKSQLDRFNSPR